MNTDILEILHNLPSLEFEHPLLGGKDPATWPDWFVGEKSPYPYYTELAKILQPKEVLEIGALAGYSLIAMLHGADSIEEIFWVDNESYVPRSNVLCIGNLTHYLSHCYNPPRHLALDHSRMRFDLLRFVNGSHFDLIHIDGDHSFEGKLQDLLISYVLKPKYIILDDYLGLAEVQEAVEFWSKTMRMNYFVVFTPDRGITVFDLWKEQDIKSQMVEAGLSIVADVSYE